MRPLPLTYTSILKNSYYETYGIFKPSRPSAFDLHVHIKNSQPETCGNCDQPKNKILKWNNLLNFGSDLFCCCFNQGHQTLYLYYFLKILNKPSILLTLTYTSDIKKSIRNLLKFRPAMVSDDIGLRCFEHDKISGRFCLIWTYRSKPMVNNANDLITTILNMEVWVKTECIHRRGSFRSFVNIYIASLIGMTTKIPRDPDKTFFGCSRRGKIQHM